jgi:hypothetical protein
MHLPILQISNHALLLFFIRTRVGKEFEVADKIRKRFTSIKNEPLYYTCYGRYDLLELLMVDSHELRNNVPVNEHIIETRSVLFYCWEGISKPIDAWAKGAPVLVAVLLNIHPLLVGKSLLAAEMQIIKVLEERFCENANLLLGMGHSEILLLLKGRDCNAILTNVSKLVRSVKIQDLKISNKFFKGCTNDTPVFICSTSYPAVAHPALRNDQSYEQFIEFVSPTVYVDCAPNLENLVVAKRPIHSFVRNVYGKYDLVIEWKRQIKMATFAKDLTDFRFEIGDQIGIQSTCTIFKSLNARKTRKKDTVKSVGASLQLSATSLAKEFLKGAKHLDHVERGQLLDFLGRFDTYYCRPESHSFFKDMAGLRHTIFTVLSKIPTASAEDRQLWQTYLSQVLDLANHAIYQRYAGIETHFEFDQHLPFPFLCDINGYIAAANSIPLFLFSAFFGTEAPEEFWPGFVLFGQSYSYQWLAGHVLSYQASALFSPIEDWWGITHEIAHSIYWLTDFLGESVDHDMQDYILKVSGLTEQGFLIDIAEIFANWFDYKYVFSSNASSYFQMIWRSWLRWERVWAYAPQYLFRSLATFLSGNLSGYYEAQDKSGPAADRFLDSQFNQMNELILKEVPEYRRFLKNIQGEQQKSIIKATKHTEHFLNFLEEKYFNQRIHKRINPNYPSHALSKHVGLIQQGEIVTEEIPSPIKLLHELYRVCKVPLQDVPLQTTAALVLTLRNYYVNKVSQRVGE